MATDDRAFLSINIKEIEKLRRSIDKKEDGLKHKGNTFHQAVILIDRWILKNFQSEGQLAYPGVGWKPLAESTIKARLRTKRVRSAAKKKGKPVIGATLKILQVNGWLRSKWNRYWNDKYAIVQSGVEYGIYHDSDKPRRRLPERKILPKEKQIMPELAKLFGKFVRTNLDKR